MVLPSSVRRARNPCTSPPGTAPAPAPRTHSAPTSARTTASGTRPFMTRLSRSRRAMGRAREKLDRRRNRGSYDPARQPGRGRAAAAHALSASRPWRTPYALARRGGAAAAPDRAAPQRRVPGSTCRPQWPAGRVRRQGAAGLPCERGHALRLAPGRDPAVRGGARPAAGDRRRDVGDRHPHGGRSPRWRRACWRMARTRPELALLGTGAGAHAPGGHPPGEAHSGGHARGAADPGARPAQVRGGARRAGAGSGGHGLRRRGGGRPRRFTSWHGDLLLRAGPAREPGSPRART